LLLFSFLSKKIGNPVGNHLPGLSQLWSVCFGRCVEFNTVTTVVAVRCASNLVKVWV